MVGHRFHIPTQPSYSGDGWSVEEARLDPGLLERSEAIFTVGNGFIGVRGCFEEARGADGSPPDAVYLNGVYETVPIHYHEGAAGLAQTSDTRPPVASGLAIDIDICGERFGLGEGTLLSYLRSLDLRAGILTRALRWQSPGGRTIDLRFERLVSFTRRSLVALRVTAQPVDFSGPVELRSSLETALPARDKGGEGVYDPRIAAAIEQDPWQLVEQFGEGAASGYVHKALNSAIAVSSAMVHFTGSAPLLEDSSEADDKRQMRLYRFAGTPDAPIRLEKFLAYRSDFGRPEDDLKAGSIADLGDLGPGSFDILAAEQREYLNAYWQGAEVSVEGDEVAERAVRYSMFQILQAAGQCGSTSIAAKGQTGEGYEGHYFWDAEIFALPLLVFTKPEVARAVLEYRYRTLPEARRNARMLGHARGALYPWRTISGRECSAYFPAGAAQYHINADIAYAVRQYVEVSGDENFMLEYGAEMVMETARIWVDLGFFNPRRGDQFCINGVTGPDEYNALANNNLYTNAMAKAHLEFASDTVRLLRAEHPGRYAALASLIGLTDEEVARWNAAAARMHLPYDETTGIHLQDDAFLDKEIWDFDGAPEENYPLLLHYHPMDIYRRQVCKQADAVMAMFLLGDRFSPEDRRRNFEFYEEVTVHDSTLSACIFSIVASDVGATAEASDYFSKAALVDLEDLHRNTGHGLHIASMGGSWMCLIHGFAGMRTLDGHLSFNPVLPAGWRELRFRIQFRGRQIEVAVTKKWAIYRLLSGAPVTIQHHGNAIELLEDAEQVASWSPAARNAAV